MRSRFAAVVALVSAGFALGLAPPAAGQSSEGLEMYGLEGSAETIAETVGGAELIDVEPTPAGIRADAVLTAEDASKLRARGVGVGLIRNEEGQTVTRAGGGADGRTGSTSGGPGTSRAASATSCYELARENPQLVKLEVLGHTHQGRELIAAQADAGRPRQSRDGSRPAVLYSSLPARARVDQPRGQPPAAAPLRRRYARATQRDQRSCCSRTELWFVVVANPDGYQYTLRSRAAVAQEPARQQQRRPDRRRRRRRPQPQLRRALGLRQRGLVARPRRRDLPWPERGVGARDAGDAGADQPHQAAVPVQPALLRRVAALPAGLAGRHARRRQPALRRARRHRRQPRDPGLQPRASRPTRSTSPTARRPTTPTPTPARSRTRRSWARAIPGAGFVFPDDEALVQAEFEKTLAFHLGLARSARRSRRSGLAGRHRRRAVLPRPGRHRPAERAEVPVRLQVRRLLRRPAGGAGARQAQPRRRARCSYQVNGGPVRTRRRPAEWTGGERYGPGNGAHYHVRPRRGHRAPRRATASRSGSRAAAERATPSPTRWRPTAAAAS